MYIIKYLPGSKLPWGRQRVPVASVLPVTNLRTGAGEEEFFAGVMTLIAASRDQAMQAVNTALIELYWEMGALISRKIKAAEWGDGVVDRLAAFIAKTEPGLRGFTRRNLFRV